MALTHLKTLTEADDPAQVDRVQPSDWMAAHTGTLELAHGGTGATTAAGARTALGLGDIALEISPLALAKGGTGSATASGARTNLGLGDLALENSPLVVAKGGTAAATAAGARTNLGLGTLAVLDSPLPLANGGTGLTALGTANQALGVNAGATGLEYKTLAGTTNRLTVTHTAGNVAFDISAGYVGQASLTTLGTVSTGTWHGTAVASGYGGTGLDSSASTGIPKLTAGTWSVNATTGDLGEGSNLYYTDARARAALSGTSPITYNSGTGAIGFSATYGGNTSLATLGTVGTGTWQATPVAPTYGGTGLDTHASSGIPSLNAGTWLVNSVLTAGQLLFGAAGNAVASSDKLIWDDAQKYLGVGCSPQAKLDIGVTAAWAAPSWFHVGVDATAYFGASTAHATSSVCATFLFRRARGTHAAPLVNVAGDRIGLCEFQGFTQNAPDDAGAIACEAETGWDGDGVRYSPGRLVFYTTPPASRTLAEAMRIDSAQHVGIGGTADPYAILDLQSVLAAFLVPRMTTAQKNALTAKNGMVLYDTTLAKFQGYENGAWTSLI